MRDQGDSVFLSRARDSVSPKRIVTKREGAGQRKLDVRLGDWTKRSEEKVEGGHRTRKERQETSLIRDFGDLKQRTRCRHTRLPLAATGSPSRAEEQRRSCSPAPSLPKIDKGKRQKKAQARASGEKNPPHAQPGNDADNVRLKI